MQDWLIAIIVAGSALAGVGVTEFRHWIDRKEKLRIMTFPKRLKAHQEALSLCYKLNLVLNRREPKEIREVADETREWWNSNCLYLDKNSRKKMIPLFNSSSLYANELEKPELYEVRIGHNVWQYLDESMKAINEGIGCEYLPVDEIEGSEKIEEAKLKHNLFNKYLISQVPVYFFASFLFMRLIHLSQSKVPIQWPFVNWQVQFLPTKAYFVLAMLLLGWAMTLCVATFLREAHKLRENIDKWSTLPYWVISVIIFGYGLVTNLVALLNAEMTRPYFYAFYAIGVTLLVFFTIQFIRSCKQRR